MAISRFTSRFKTRTDLMDNITPNNVVQMNASVPAGEWKPASWLPVVWQNEKSKDYFTISSGKVVSFDSSGRIVPSGLLRRCLDATAKTDVIIAYDANDVAARVIDITTGNFVAGDNSVTLAEFITAAKNLGWIHTDLSGDTLAVYQEGAKDFISAPVGVAAYDVYVWAGDDAGSLHFTNYQKQHLIQFFSDVQMRVGHVCKSTATVVTLGGGGAAIADIVDADTLSRYDGLPNKNDLVALDLKLGKLASITSRTPLTFGAGDFVGRLREDLALLSKKGDYFLDADAGLLLFYKSGGNGAPVDINDRALADTDTISVFDYSASASAQEKMMHLVGPAKCGDFVTFDKNSNFKVLAPLDLASTASAAPAVDFSGNEEADEASVKTSIDTAVDALKSKLETALETRHFAESLVIGRIYELQKEPRGLLERVKTGFSGSEFGADAKMPGSATKGFSDLITLSDEKISDEIAIINVKVQ